MRPAKTPTYLKRVVKEKWEKEGGFPAPLWFKSAGAGEYTGGTVVGAEAEERRS
jgi:hypothetical protein